MSTWVFSCSLGLAQDKCGEYERDENSRGVRQRFGGCASCVNRVPHNKQTQMAEWAFEDRQQEKQDATKQV
jgi:hypothetical protein